MSGKSEAVNGQSAPPSVPRAAPGSGIGWNEVKAELIEFFSSIKLAMSLFLIIAVAATIGTVIQQNERADVYIKEYGEEAYRWFLRLGWTDIYHTWYFTSLLALLCINSLTCFRQRFPGIWRSMHQDKVSVQLPFIKSMNLSFPVLIDSWGKTDMPYKRMGVPETFIIDQEGVIPEIIIGPRDWTRLDGLGVLTGLLKVIPKTVKVVPST